MYARQDNKASCFKSQWHTCSNLCYNAYMTHQLTHSRELRRRIKRHIELMKDFDKDEVNRLKRLYAMLLADFPYNWSGDITPGVTVVECEGEYFEVLKRKELKFLELLKEDTYHDNTTPQHNRTDARVLLY